MFVDVFLGCVIVNAALECRVCRLFAYDLVVLFALFPTTFMFRVSFSSVLASVVADCWNRVVPTPICHQTPIVEVIVVLFSTVCKKVATVCAWSWNAVWAVVCWPTLFYFFAKHICANFVHHRFWLSDLRYTFGYV